MNSGCNALHSVQVINFCVQKVIFRFFFQYFQNSKIMKLGALVFKWQRSKVKTLRIFSTSSISSIFKLFKTFLNFWKSNKIRTKIGFLEQCGFVNAKEYLWCVKTWNKKSFPVFPPSSSSHVFQAFHEIKNRWVLWKKNSGTEEYHLKCWQWASKPYLKCNP